MPARPGPPEGRKPWLFSRVVGMAMRMRGQLLVAGLLALTISACGGAANNDVNSKPLPGDGEEAAGLAPGSSTASKSSSSSASTPGAAPVLRVTRRYIPPAVRLKTASGKAPAVVLLPDTTDSARADREAQKLSRLGVGALVVVG